MSQPILTHSFGLDLLIFSTPLVIYSFWAISYYYNKQTDQKLNSVYKKIVTLLFWSGCLLGAIGFLPFIIGYFWFIFENWLHPIILVSIILFLAIFLPCRKKPQANA